MNPFTPLSFDERFELFQKGSYVIARDRRGASAREGEQMALGSIPPRYRSYDRANWRGVWPIPEALKSWPTAPAGAPPAGAPPADAPPAGAPPTGAPAGKSMILFLGSQGAGKTHCATALWREAVARWPYGGSWFDALALLDSEKAAIGTGAPSRDTEAAMSRGLLLLDDLGAERGTDYAREFVSKILRHRHRENYPTILTSNAPDLAALEGSLDSRVVSRLAECAHVVVLGGPDRRIFGAGN